MDNPSLEGEAFDIVHISTSARGGAGIAARRIAQAQRQELGKSVAFVSRDALPSPDAAFDSDVAMVNIELHAAQRSLSRLATGVNRIVSKPNAWLFTPVSISVMSERHTALTNCGYLQVHNTLNMASMRRIPSLFRGKILVTLHDERQLTNGCHYTLGCLRFASDCRDCPQSRLSGLGLLPRRRGNHLFFDEAADRVVFVAPSKWMAGQARSAGLAEERVFHVPNPIDTSQFSPAIREEARQGAVVPPDSIVIAWQPGKNDAILAAALVKLKSSLPPHVADSVVVLTPGPASVSLAFRSISLGPLETELDRARFWAAADVGVSATTMDNFPNVVLESLAVGTPFVIPRVGGAGEAIDSTGGGVVVDSPEPGQIAHALRDLVLSPSLTAMMGARGTHGVRANYGYMQFASRMAALL